jgi:hypothetical protein
MTTHPERSTGSVDKGVIEDRRPRVLRRLATAAVLMPLALATIGVAPMLAASTAEGRVVTASGASCPMHTKVNGVSATAYCGLATAMLKIGTKSYSFKNGYCQSIKTAGLTIDLELGTLVGTGGKGNAGKPYFVLDLYPGKQSRSDSVSAIYGGKEITGGAVGVAAKGSIIESSSSKGTFTSSTPVPPKLSGSWSCNGGGFPKN